MDTTLLNLVLGYMSGAAAVGFTVGLIIGVVFGWQMSKV
jgi:hypothetical protein